MFTQRILSALKNITVRSVFNFAETKSKGPNF